MDVKINIPGVDFTFMVNKLKWYTALIARNSLIDSLSKRILCLFLFVIIFLRVNHNHMNFN